MVKSNTFRLVEGDQSPDQELQVLLLERNSKTIDNRSQNLKKFTDSIVPFGLVDKSVKDVRNCASDEGTVRHEFTVNAVKNGFEVVAFSRIFGIEELDELETKLLVDVFFGSLCVNFARDNESQKEFVGNLEMRPGWLKDGFVFFRIKVVGSRWQSPADIGGNHGHEISHDGFGKNLLASGSVNVIN